MLFILHFNMAKKQEGSDLSLTICSKIRASKSVEVGFHGDLGFSTFGNNFIQAKQKIKVIKVTA